PPKSLTALLRCYHPVLIIADDRLRVIGIHGRLASSQPTKRACGGDSSDSLFPSTPTQVFSPHPRPLPLKGPDAQYDAEISDRVVTVLHTCAWDPFRESKGVRWGCKRLTIPFETHSGLFAPPAPLTPYMFEKPILKGKANLTR